MKTLVESLALDTKALWVSISKTNETLNSHQRLARANAYRQLTGIVSIKTFSEFKHVADSLLDIKIHSMGMSYSTSESPIETRVYLQDDGTMRARY
jgi:cystathionine beta-lyase/cystathionine gamma-synthase